MLRRGWAEVARGGGVAWPVGIDEDSALHVFCSDQKTAETIEAASDTLAANLNSKTNRPMLVTRVRAHVAALPTLILARRIGELETLLIELA
ncbi:MAG: hypothetical protein BroJett024_43150 [Alphaproteobacteria bacterium]|nr:MAG: hypothetical protein BroJett024_43150 [Alphaproteobacteria bacterium]